MKEIDLEIIKIIEEQEKEIKEDYYQGIAYMTKIKLCDMDKLKKWKIKEIDDIVGTFIGILRQENPEWDKKKIQKLTRIFEAINNQNKQR